MKRVAEFIKSHRKIDLLLTFILLLINLTLLGMIFEKIYFRFDLTTDKKYSLSTNTRDILNSLKYPLKIKVFFSPNLPAPYNSYERYLKDLLGEYKLIAKDKLTIEYVDLKSNPEAPSEFGIYPVAIEVIEKDQLQYRNAYMGLVLLHGDMIEKIPQISSAEGLEYRISMLIKKMGTKINRINSLETNFQIFLLGNNQLPVKNIEYLEDIVAPAILNVKQKLNKKLTYKFIDTLFDKEGKEFIKKYNFPPILLKNVKSDKKPSIEKGYIGIVVKYKEDFRIVNILEEDEDGILYIMNAGKIENAILDAVENLLAIKKKIGYITGHGEPQFFEGYGEEEKGDSVSRFANFIDETYEFQPISILKSSIPDDVEALLIVEPKLPFEKEELFKIDQFIMSGKPVIFFVGGLFFPIQEKALLMAGNIPRGVIPQTGLFEMISNYGVLIEHKLVLDKNCYSLEIPKVYGGGAQKIYYYPIVERENISQKHDITKKVKGMFLVRVSPLTFLSEITNNYKINFTPLVKSGKESWLEGEGVMLSPTFLATRIPENFSNYTVAGVLEGELPSYFKGKNFPNINEKTKFKEKAENGRLVIVGSGDMAKNLIIDIEGNSPNSIFIRNIIDWCLGNKDLIKLRIKGLSYNPPKATSEVTKSLIKWGNTFGTAILVIILGLILWQLDLYRRKKIKAKFLKEA